MKKIIAILFSIICVLSLAVPTFAENSYFDESPTGKPTPSLGEGVENVTIVGYGNRDTLTDEQRVLFEAAYNSIATPTDNMNQVLATLADKYGIDIADLAISDLFYLAETAEVEGAHSIELSSENFDKYVALLSYENGEWKILDDAKVDENGNLVFDSENLGVHAVVIRTDGQVTTPDEGIGAGGIVAIVIGAVVVAGGIAAFLFFFVFKKKGVV